MTKKIDFYFDFISPYSFLAHKKIYAPLNIMNGNIEVTKYLQRLEVGKKIKINQNGRTPKFTQ